MADPVVHVHNLGKRFRVWTHPRPTNLKERIAFRFGSARRQSVSGGVPLVQEIWALRGAEFQVGRGEVLGVMGPNGAGKSTLLSLLARITEPTEGYAELRGRVSSLLEVGTGFHPELSGRDNIFLNGAVLGMSRSETAAKYDEIVDFSGVGEFIDIPVKRYSTGMYLRLAFSVAAHLDPEILLLDEVLAVGDQAFQQKCLARIDEITQSGRTVLFVSHDVRSIARLCRRALLVQDGHITYEGAAAEAIERYQGTRPHLLGGGHLGSGVDRSGNGDLRFCNVRILGSEGGAVVVGGPVEIELELAGVRAVAAKYLHVTVSVSSPIGGAIATFSTRFQPEGLLGQAELTHGSTVTCRVDHLPLSPGRYFLSLSLDRPGEVIDRVANQVEFNVLPADFYGSGVLPGQDDGPVLMRQQWQFGRTESRGAAAS